MFGPRFGRVKEAIMSEGTAVLMCYFLGALATLFEKARKYVYIGKKAGRSPRECLEEWFFDPTVSNISSWSGTIGAVWVGGYLYVNQIPKFFGIDMPEIIVAAPIGFVLGCLWESVAPNLIKLFTSKLPFGGKEDK
jgi:hypothetical protein